MTKKNIWEHNLGDGYGGSYVIIKENVRFEKNVSLEQSDDGDLNMSCKNGKLGIAGSLAIASAKSYGEVVKHLTADLSKIKVGHEFVDKAFGVTKGILTKVPGNMYKVFKIKVMLDEERENDSYEDHSTTHVDEGVAIANYLIRSAFKKLAIKMAAEGVTRFAAGTVVSIAVGAAPPLWITIGVGAVATVLYDESGLDDLVSDAARSIFRADYGVIAKLVLSEIGAVVKSVVDVPNGNTISFDGSTAVLEHTNNIVNVGSNIMYDIEPDDIEYYTPPFSDSLVDLKMGSFNLFTENYVIKSGDTLSQLAKDHNTTVEEILQFNPEIKNPDFILVDQVISLPQAIKKVEIKAPNHNQTYDFHDKKDVKNVIENAYGDNIQNKEQVIEDNVISVKNSDGSSTSLIKSDSKAKMKDGSEVDLNELVDMTYSQVQSLEGYVNAVALDRLKSLFDMNQGENQVNSDFDSLMADLAKAANEGKNIAQIAESLLAKNMNKDIARKLVDQSLDGINGKIKDVIGIDLASSIGKIDEFLGSKSVEEKAEEIILTALKDKIKSQFKDGDFDQINKIAKNFGAQINDIDEFLESKALELIAKNYAIEELSKKVLKDVKDSSINKINELAGVDVESLLKDISSGDLNDLAKGAVLNYVGEDFARQQGQSHIDDFNAQIADSFGVDIAKINKTIDRYLKEKDVTKIAQNIIVDTVGEDVVNQLAQDQLNNVNDYIFDAVGIDIKGEIANISTYLKSGEGQIITGGVAAVGNIVIQGIINGDVGSSFESIAKEKITGVVETGITNVAKHFGASSKLAGNVAGAAIEVFNLLDQGVTGESLMHMAVSRVVGTIATALIQTLVPFLPPFLSSTIGSFIGGLVSSLFGGPPPPPPPPLTITEPKEDGGTITYITKDSFGYSLEAKDGSKDDLVGGDKDDNLIGSNEINNLYGQGGDDLINARAGDDKVIAGDGDDYVQGGDGDDLIDGGAGNDRLYGDRIENYGTGDDRIFGGKGNDEIHGGAGDDEIHGGEDGDRIFGDAGEDDISGDAGDDYIHGGDGNDSIQGGLGNDSIEGGKGMDYVLGGIGDDIIIGGEGNDYLQGEIGDDRIDGGIGDDSLSGGSGDDILVGGAGDDKIKGGSGDDKLFGGKGTNILIGGSGADQFVVDAKLGGLDLVQDFEDGVDKINIKSDSRSGAISELDFSETDAKGNLIINFKDSNQKVVLEDSKEFREAFNVNDIIFTAQGAATNVSINYDSATKSILVNKYHDDSAVGNYLETKDNFNNSENIFNSEVDQTIFNNEYWKETGGKNSKNKLRQDKEFSGTSENDEIYASWWNETINAGDGHDQIFANKGDDRVNAGAGNDWVDGGIGNDAIYGQEGLDKIVGGDGNDYIEGGEGNDVVYGQFGADVIKGGSGDDYLDGGDGGDLIEDFYGSNIVSGGQGSDKIILDKATIDTSANNNVIDGGGGNDYIIAGDGDDVIYGGQGRDEIHGGAGDDVYYYRKGDNLDIISDVDGNNKIIIEGYEFKDAQFYEYGGSRIIMFNEDEQEAIVINNRSNFDQISFGNDKFNIDELFSSAEVLDGSALKMFFGDERGNRFDLTKGDDKAYGGDGNDDIYGLKGDDKLYGDLGNDRLYGGEGSDVLAGGRGDDRLYGGAGEDRYIYSRGDGADVIYDVENSYSHENDILKFSDMTLNELIFRREGNHMVIRSIYDTADKITLENHFYYDNNEDKNSQYHRIEKVEFADGQILNLKEESILYFGDSEDYQQLGGVSGDVVTSNMSAVDGTGSRSYGGNFTNDYMYGGSGGNHLIGLGGDDHIITGSGNDILEGGKGNDKLYGQDDHDRLYGGWGADLLDGGSGDDRLYAGEGDDNLLGGSGNDHLEGDEGDDVLAGGSGNDNLYGEVGADVLHGGAGNDNLDGGDGNDTYLFNKGDGHDVIYDSGSLYGLDSIKFGAGISRNDLIFTNSGYHLIITFRNSSADKLTVRYQNYSRHDDHRIENLEFSDGSTMDISTGKTVKSYYSNSSQTIRGSNDNDDVIYARGGNDDIRGYSGDDRLYGESGNDVIYAHEGDDYLDGGSGNDKLYGYDGDDVMKGGIGNDYIDGNAGNDIYLFNKGDGHDQIYDSRYADSLDIIEFGSSIKLEDLILTRDGDHLIIKFKNNSSDSILVKYHFEYDGRAREEDLYHRIELLKFSDGREIDFRLGSSVKYEYDDNSQTIHGSHRVDDVIYAKGGNDTIKGYRGNDTIYAGSGNDRIYGYENDDYLLGESGNDTIYGGHGSDILQGGIGNDYLDGSEGSDSYIFNRGDGQDTIYDHGRADDYDILKFGLGITAEDLILTKDTRSNSLIITFKNHSSDKITIREQFYSREYHKIEEFQFSDGKKVIFDEFYLGKITGNSGNNDLRGSYYNDHIKGESGNDYLRAYEGEDILDGGYGNDTLYGYAGDDLLIGGRGNDYLNGGTGSDTYIFNKGDGHDTIYDGDRADAMDVVKFGAGISQDDIILRRGRSDDQHLYITFKNNSSDSIKLRDHFYYDGRSYSHDQHHLIERLEFADGSSISLQNATFVHDNNSENPIRGSNHGNDTIYALGGNDKVYGYDGDDVLIGGKGNDYLNGDRGNDIYVFNKGDGHDEIYDDDYADSLDIIRFGAGVSSDDLIIRRDSNSRHLTINFKNNSSDSIKIINHFYYDGDLDLHDQRHLIERLEFADGSSISLQNATFTHSNSSETIQGSNHGNDIIYALGGNDKVYGYGGDDILIGGSGSDYLDGGNGSDTVSYETSSEKVVVSVKYNSTSGGDASGDTIRNIENITGSNYYDRLFGNDDANVLRGLKGNDYITARNGNDIIEGGEGADKIYGGGGDDIFKYSSLEDSKINVIDRIIDFEQSADQIDVSNIDSLSFNSFEFEIKNGHTIIKDINSDFAIDLSGQFALNEDDFIF